MKFALAQMRVIPNAPEQNIANMLELIDDAKHHQADIIVFPELCVSGYLLADQWLNRQFCRDIMAFNELIRLASDNITVIYGSIYEVLCEQHSHSNSSPPDSSPPNKDGRSRLYNAAYVFQNQQPAKRCGPTEPWLPDGVQPKTLLPNYRFFDDQRYFFSLADVALDANVPLHNLAQPFAIKSATNIMKIGVQVCEDLWCKDYRSAGQSINISRHLVRNGAQALVNISASPWTFHKNDARDRRITFLKSEIEPELSFVPFYYVNNVGAQNNGKNIITFDGDSSAYNAQGKLSAELTTPFEQGMLYVDHQSVEQQNVTRPAYHKIAQKYLAIIAGLKHVPEMLGWQSAPDFVIGLSGGVDSALVAALVTLAYGKEKVWSVNMPTQYNSQKTQDAARSISENLGIRHMTIPISPLVDATQAVFDELDTQCPSPQWMRTLSDENIQAKVRGTSILSNIAGRYGRMFTNNGNKVEIALGYATLYGDVGGVIAPIGDLTKEEVFEMVRYLNEAIFHREVLPESLLPDALFRFGKEDIAPSAELRNAQIDPMKFGYHCKLLESVTSFQKTSAEDIMRWYLDGCLAEKLHMDPRLITRWGIDDPQVFMTDLAWFYEGIRNNVFKRIQSPPIILTSPSAYGFDIREAQLPQWQSDVYKVLQNKITAMDKYQGG